MRLRSSAALAAGLLAVTVASAGADLVAESWPLDEATTVVLVEDHRVPLVQVVVEFPVGRWSPWAREHHAREAFEIQLYDREGKLRRRADALAAGLRVSMGDLAARVEATCLREDLDGVLELIRDVLTGEDFDRSRLVRWKRQRRIERDTQEKQPAFRRQRAMLRALYGAEDPRRLAHERPGSVVTRIRALLPVRDRIVRLPGRVVAFAGALDRETATRAAGGLLPAADPDVPAGLEPPLPPARAQAGAPAVVELRGIEQVFFADFRESPSYADPGYGAFLLADHVLGGHFFSRLYVALRHEGGETYGAGTSGLGSAWTEPYAVLTFTGPDNRTRVREELAVVLERFHRDGIDERERAAAAGFLRGRAAFRRQSPGQVLRRFLHERRLGLEPGQLDALVERAAETPLDDVNAWIREFYDPALFRRLEVVPE